MELLTGRPAARTRRGRVELLVIAFAVFHHSVVAAQVIFQPVMFEYGRSRDPDVVAPGNTTIRTLQMDDITCLGDFFADSEGLKLSLQNPLGNYQQGVNLTGRCLYRYPIQLKQRCFVTSFSTYFQLQFIPNLGDILHGTLQGVAFIIASDNSTQGEGGGYLGWLNATTNDQPGKVSTDHNFAVEIDFFQDVQFQDPFGVHVGVDNNSLTSVPSPYVLLSTQFDVWDIYQMNFWIDYDGISNTLKVFATNYTHGQKPSMPILNTNIDLTEVLSQEGMFVGFSGSISDVNFSTSGVDPIAFTLTGFQIYDWTFNSNGLAPDFPGWAVAKPKLPSRIIIISVTIPSVLLFVLLVLIIYKLYRRIARLTALTKKYEIEEGVLEGGPQRFKYRELSKATKGFSSDGLVGSGGFGSVYRGTLVPKGAKKSTDIAVKRISAASQQGAREFLAEVKVIGQVQHRNLVRLLGCCYERGELLLVYDYMPNGSLDQHLFNAASAEKPVLTWARRLKIVSGIAMALAYLHEEWEKRVIHRDVKSSNVMLDGDFNARLGDFGLARLSEHDRAPQSTAVLAGTYGYLAPELPHNLKATEKTDVYSFGALVLEVATGKRPVLSFEDQKVFNVLLLVDWVWSLYSDNVLLQAADSRLQGLYDPGEMTLFLKIGLLCSHPDPDERPPMREVLNIWKGSSPFPQLPRNKPVPSFISSIKEGFGPDTGVTIPMDVYSNSVDSVDESDRTLMLNSQDDSHSFALETLPLGLVTASSTLHNRRTKTTTSLPL